MSEKLERAEPPTLVILLHGIRTRAWWQNVVATIVEEETGATVIPIKYGYFDLLRFLCPFRTCRKAAIEKIRKQIEGIREQFKGYRLVIFAHSFGTYALAQILLENAHFTFDRVVLCGSIISESYNWSRVENQIVAPIKRNAIINECGLRDPWPVLAKSLGSGYGATGTYGFGDYNVRDRFHPFKHSDFFDPGFISDFWIPAVRNSKPKPSPTDSSGQGAPEWFSLLHWPLRLFVLCIWMFVVVLFTALMVQKPNEAKATAIIGSQTIHGEVSWSSFVKRLEPTAEPKPTITARAFFPQQKLELWLTVTRYPRRFERIDMLSRKLKCDNGETAFCKPPLPQLDISHIMVVTLRGRNDNHGNIMSLKPSMKPDIGPETVEFDVDATTFAKSPTQDQVSIGWPSHDESERRNLVALRRFPALQLRIDFSDGTHSHFLLEKGRAGTKVVNDIVNDWMETIGQE